MGIAPSCADGTSTKKILVNCKKNVKWKIGEWKIGEEQGATDDLLRDKNYKTARAIKDTEKKINDRVQLIDQNHRFTRRSKTG